MSKVYEIPWLERKDNRKIGTYGANKKQYRIQIPHFLKKILDKRNSILLTLHDDFKKIDKGIYYNNKLITLNNKPLSNIPSENDFSNINNYIYINAIKEPYICSVADKYLTEGSIENNFLRFKLDDKSRINLGKKMQKKLGLEDQLNPETFVN